VSVPAGVVQILVGQYTASDGSRYRRKKHRRIAALFAAIRAAPAPSNRSRHQISARNTAHIAETSPLRRRHSLRWMQRRFALAARARRARPGGECWARVPNTRRRCQSPTPTAAAWSATAVERRSVTTTTPPSAGKTTAQNRVADLFGPVALANNRELRIAGPRSARARARYASHTPTKLRRWRGQGSSAPTPNPTRTGTHGAWASARLAARRCSRRDSHFWGAASPRMVGVRRAELPRDRNRRAARGHLSLITQDRQRVTSRCWEKDE